MKNKIVSLLLVFALAIGGLAFAGCNPSNNNAERFTIYTSMYPIYDFTKKIVGNHADIINLVGPGEEAHHYELKASQRAELEHADLIIINGYNMEHWVEDLPETITSKILVASDGIQTIQRERNGVMRTDAHLWLSLRNGKAMMENIKNKMVELDSANAATYERNYARYSILFDALDSQYVSAVSNFSSTTVVVSHAAFGYLANDYGLTQLSISGLDTDDESDPQTVAAIIDYINENNVKAVFYQETISATIANAIAEQTEAVVDILYTIESLSDEDVKAGEDFLSLMAHNLVALISALN